MGFAYDVNPQMENIFELLPSFGCYMVTHERTQGQLMA